MKLDLFVAIQGLDSFPMGVASGKVISQPVFLAWGVFDDYLHEI